jgi:hypothetical protein
VGGSSRRAPTSVRDDCVRPAHARPNQRQLVRSPAALYLHAVPRVFPLRTYNLPDIGDHLIHFTGKRKALFPGTFAVAGAGFEPATSGVMSRLDCVHAFRHIPPKRRSRARFGRGRASRRNVVTSLRKPDACRTLAAGDGWYLSAVDDPQRTTRSGPTVRRSKSRARSNPSSGAPERRTPSSRWSGRSGPARGRGGPSSRSGAVSPVCTSRSRARSPTRTHFVRVRHNRGALGIAQINPADRRR